MFAAETASNFNQALVRASLLATNTDRDFQIAVIEEAMSNFHRYFFIMPTLSRFELEFHTRVERGETPHRRPVEQPHGRSLRGRLRRADGD